MNESYRLFIESVDDKNKDFVDQLNAYIIEHGFKCDIKTAKNGYVVSYVSKKTKKTLANFVFRKSGIKIRIYANNVQKYENFLNTIPENMKKDIKKSLDCKRLLDPTDCNPRCSMGYIYLMDGVEYKKCRYGAFMPTLTEENNPFIIQFIKNEIACVG